MTDRRLLRLDVENFRSLQRISLPLGGLTVLVGPNGVGKSNVLQVFRFLSDIINSDLDPALSSRGGFDEVAFWGGDRPPTMMRIGLQARWTSHASAAAPDEYQLTINRRGNKRAVEGYSISRSESFTFKRNKGRGRRITVSGEEAVVTDTIGHESSDNVEDSGERSLGIRKLSSGLSTLPRLAPTEGGQEVATVAEVLSSFRVFDVNVSAARSPQRVPAGPIPTRPLRSNAGRTRQMLITGVPHSRPVQLGHNAGNLAIFLSNLAQDETAWDRLVEDARIALPNLEDINFATIGGAGEFVEVQLSERGLRRPTPLADASFGTVRLLSLLAMLYDPAPPALTCVEELDHGLHPQALELLVERLREASERSQFIVTTHSPALVDRLEPEEFVVCERDRNGASLIPSLSTDEVREIRAASEGLPLGELWFTGALGGGL
ncbi:AAA family ATPase [Kitasatospora purpeofusca]|uniref:AAA family ATPase n=1 Tax=Kitasatospora purpeofusca TaxID=67352 RepID=UPI002A59C8FB|nr:AAA family ATPase [Kitasatospora purpeofusca]MDY0812395.1 AAA family ATPase [Kitasatospora purpeofusca]